MSLVVVIIVLVACTILIQATPGEFDQPVSTPGDQPAPAPVPNSRSPPTPSMAERRTVSTVPSTSDPPLSTHNQFLSARQHAYRPVPAHQ